MSVASHRHCGNRSTQGSKVSPLIRLWLLRVLIPLGGYREWVEHNSYSDPSDEMIRVLGLCPEVYDEEGVLDKQAAIVELRALHSQMEKRASRVRLPKLLAANCTRIAKLIGFDKVSQRILVFTVCLHQQPILQEVTDLLGVLSVPRLVRQLAILLGVSDMAIQQALGLSGVLAQSGLVTVKPDSYGEYHLRHKLDVLNGGFVERMSAAAEDPMALFRDTILPTPAPELTLADYNHVRSLRDIMLPLLDHTLETGKRGVNILLYGRPGTGKTQLTRVLAATLNAQIFEVSSEDDDGDPIDGEKRLRAYRASLCVVSNSRSILAFDEAEDVFSGGDNYFHIPRGPAQKSKAWINRILENNPVPCLWITNSIEGIDPAFIRRFDVVQEVPVPPQKQRTHMIDSVCRDLSTTALSRRLAGSEELAPAVVARAATVARTIHKGHTPDESSRVIECLVNNTLMAQGHAALPPSGTPLQCLRYDPTCINVETDPERLVQGIARTKAARLCLYGPPGTGKTAFARWLAESIDKPLFTRRVSDLIAPYVGESEQNIAAAFRQAGEEGAVFLLDEVDSFLQDRRAARHSWEVTLVNEVLTHMEAFTGVFVAATNLMDGIDPAALRRFDLKLYFGYLQLNQAWPLLKQCATSLGLPAPEDCHKSTIANLVALTPGDFATVIRQAHFQPFPDTSALVAALVAECATKKDGPRRAIGFV